MLKELRETRIWLILVQRKGLVKPAETVAEVQAECDELVSIFASSIKTTEKGK